jgi:spore germination protein PC
MYMTPEMARYFQQLHGYLQSQNKQIEEMNTRIHRLIQDVDYIKRNIQPPVIKNEYKFDLLKVERLEGTLNIGLNPNGADGSIEEFAVNQSVESRIVKNHPELYKQIQQKMNEYFSSDAYRALKQLEKKYRYPLDDSYRKFIVDDVKKQVDKRIQYYLGQVNDDQVDTDQLDKYVQEVFRKVQIDVEKTFEDFIKNIPREEPDS